MPQSFLGEYHRINEDLLVGVVARMFLVETHRAWTHLTRDIGAAEVGGQITAGVSTADFESGKTVEDSVENHAGEKHGRLERIADDVAEIASSFEPALLDDVIRSRR